MFVRKSKYSAEMARAQASGSALAQLTGELVDGLTALGIRHEPRDGETTAGLAIAALRRAVDDLDGVRIALRDAKAEIASLRPDAEKHRRSRAALIPGGPKAKEKREAEAAALTH